MKRYFIFPLILNLFLIILFPIVQLFATGIEKKSPQALVRVLVANVVNGKSSDNIDLEYVKIITDYEIAAIAGILNRERAARVVNIYFVFIIFLNVMYSYIVYKKLKSISSNQSLKGRM